MKKLLPLFAGFILSSLLTRSQGCIAVRNINGFGQYNLTDNAFSTSKWQLDLTNRYFRSSRDFKEAADLKTPPQNATINEVVTFDMVLSRLLNNGWSMALNLPITDNTRTSTGEHGGPNTPRHATRSFGSGDLRFTVYKWLRLPAPDQKWNIQLGLGLKLATGAYNYQDYFYRNDSTKVLSAVNPSIQLGDGGTGIITEIDFFTTLSKTFTFYGDFYYLISPRDENGTLYTAGRTPTTLQIATDGINNSVPDAFSLHAGIYINMSRLSFSAAVRDEGSPVYDLVGGSDGIRRAGHYLSVEPGIIYKMKNITLYTYAPIIADRKIEQNVPDKKATAMTGIYTVGAGSSANYELFAGVSLRF